MVKAVGEYLRGAAEVPHHRTLIFVGAQSPEDDKGTLGADFDTQCQTVWAKIIAALGQKNIEPRHIVAVETDLADRAHLDAAASEQKRHLRHHIAQTIRIVGMPDERWMLQVAVVAAVTR
ncbi:MAG: hypothetical protein P8Q36_20605 [Alphaproteobacteria bacterium]|jgi:enamine deaminase RidA (YjgF/YER057c/UK114 family)|nr:RidA family protein [Rhodospirillaceae bacterium]MDG2483246.1 hypothetical protein [Alphaproteobacteria bacterium]MBT6203008.1 RidA family protein [Rhodospirillaceae bacterium]MBT6509011.1 RidA family protein [Rhodospirillaceae bacterium]MBT7612142.1 RidA family protein [Rhodospirillaceae bacterium]